MPSETDTIFFIPKEKLPAGRTVTYGVIVDNIQPQKAETYLTWLIVGGILINFPGDFTTPTADLITAKLIFNSVVSTKIKNACVQTLPTSIWTIPWTDVSIWNYHWTLSQRRSSNNTSSETYHTKVLYIWKFKSLCMDYPKQEKLQMINFSYIYPSLGTIQYPSPQVCDGTKCAPFHFHW